MIDYAYQIGQFKSANEEEIRREVEQLAYRFRNCADELRSFFPAYLTSSFMEKESFRQQLLIQKIAILSLILSDISTTPRVKTRQAYIEKIGRVAESLSIEYSDLLAVVGYADKIEKALFF